MEKETLIIATDGTVIEPPFHDGKLVSLLIGDESTAVLTIATVDYRVYKIELNEVISLVANNFRNGNIILDVTIIGGEEVDTGKILSCLGIESYERHSAYVDSIVARFKEGALFLVEINPSYGCALLCICGKYNAVFG